MNRITRALYRIVNRPLLRELEQSQRDFAAYATQQVKLEELVYREGELSLRANGELCKIIAASLCQMYREVGGANYLEIQMIDPKNGERFAVTVQRVQGKSPAELHTITRAALAELVQRCDTEPGVRADGSNIDTAQAHAALDALDKHSSE